VVGAAIQFHPFPYSWPHGKSLTITTSVRRPMRFITTVLLAAFCFVVSSSQCAAQNNNSTLIVYSSTFVPFDSSFSVQNSNQDAFTAFPLNFKRVDSQKLDSTRRTCGRRDANGDGDLIDNEDLIKEVFGEIYIGFSIKNLTDETLTIDSLVYEVGNPQGPSHHSTRIRPEGSPVAEPGKKTWALFRFVKNHPSGRRQFLGQETTLPRRVPRRTVWYTVNAHTGSKDEIIINHRNFVAFADVDNCPERMPS